METIKSFFQFFTAWKVWHNTFTGLLWLDWLLYLAIAAAVLTGIYRGFGFFFSWLIHSYLLVLATGLLYPWIADAAVKYLKFAKAGFWYPVCFLLTAAGIFFLIKKITGFKSKKAPPSIHPFWDRVIGAVCGFFLVLLVFSFVSQFFVLLPSKQIDKFYGSKGAKYGPVLKKFVPQVIDGTLAPVRLLVNRKK